jgi:hypothetical protein
MEFPWKNFTGAHLIKHGIEEVTSLFNPSALRNTPVFPGFEYWLLSC